jgi:hypothetical protein
MMLQKRGMVQNLIQILPQGIQNILHCHEKFANFEKLQNKNMQKHAYLPFCRATALISFGNDVES